MAGSASLQRLISIYEWVCCGLWRIGATWFARPTQESARSLILMAKLRVRHRSGFAPYSTERRISARIALFTRSMAMSSRMRTYSSSSYCWLGGRMLEELIERYNQLKTRSEDVRRFL